MLTKPFRDQFTPSEEREHELTARDVERTEDSAVLGMALLVKYGYDRDDLVNLVDSALRRVELGLM